MSDVTCSPHTGYLPAGVHYGPLCGGVVRAVRDDGRAVRTRPAHTAAEQDAAHTAKCALGYHTQNYSQGKCCGSGVLDRGHSTFPSLWYLRKCIHIY